jgi:anaerobic selenocysteine-containing dehydrogenase
MTELPRIAHLPSVCPHDCPSACSLEVEVIDGRSIGRVRGSKRQSYTDGVICAKVARYSERIHHPDRLLHPLRRTGPKGSGQFERISWDEALDEIARRFLAIEPSTARKPSGPITMRARWAWSCATASTACATPRAIPASTRRSAPPWPGPASSPAPASSPGPIRARWPSRIAW